MEFSAKYCMWVLLGLMVPQLLFSQPDSLSLRSDSLLLKEAVLVSWKNESILRNSGEELHLDTHLLGEMPALLGSNDPVRVTRFLPSMQMASEIDAGVHIQGNDHSHNIISSGGVPIYGANHLFGLFSVFNPSHYSYLDYSTYAPECNRLGGKLDMALPESPAERLKGEFSLGLLALQGNISVPFGKQGKGSLSTSFRRSFLNLLYGSFLSFGSSSLQYGFTDVNVTGIWKASDKDKLWLDVYFGNDAVGMNSGDGMVDVDLPWYNVMGAVHHEHSFSGGGSFREKAYYSRFALSPVFYYSSISIKIPSDISTAGYEAQWTFKGIRAGMSLIGHMANPQQLYPSGSYFGKASNPPTQYGQEGTLFAGYRHRFGEVNLDAQMKMTIWHGPDGKWVPEAGPYLAIGYSFPRAGTLELKAAIAHQNLVQAGFTGIGLPFEFWMLSGTVCPPQSSTGATLSYHLPFSNDRFSLSAELYYKALGNQTEYVDGIADLINRPYSLEEALRCGRGRTFGANLMLHKQAGSLTGWMSASWGRSLRTFSGEEGEIPSSHERIFEIDLVALYQVGNWRFSLSSVVAGGTPYTPASSFYILGSYPMKEYAERNSARLPVYHRTDIGVNYLLAKSSGFEHRFSFSLYNMFMADNPIYRTLYIGDDGVSYRFEGIGIRLMPSIGYTLDISGK